MTAVTFTRSIYQWIIDSVYSFKNQANIFFFCRNLFQPDDYLVHYPNQMSAGVYACLRKFIPSGSISSTVSVKLLLK